MTTRDEAWRTAIRIYLAGRFSDMTSDVSKLAIDRALEAIETSANLCTQPPDTSSAEQAVAWIDGADIGFLRDGYATRIVHRTQVLPCMVPLYTRPQDSGQREAVAYGDALKLMRKCIDKHDAREWSAVDIVTALDLFLTNRGERYPSDSPGTNPIDPLIFPRDPLEVERGSK